jgi:hypothetical protein
VRRTAITHRVSYGSLLRCTADRGLNP